MPGTRICDARTPTFLHWSAHHTPGTCLTSTYGYNSVSTMGSPTSVPLPDPVGRFEVAASSKLRIMSRHNDALSTMLYCPSTTSAVAGARRSNFTSSVMDTWQPAHTRVNSSTNVAQQASMQRTATGTLGSAPTTSSFVKSSRAGGEMAQASGG